MPHIINLPKFEDPRGNLSFIEEFKHIPFKMERVYWIYDVPGGEIRGGHAFKVQQEIIVALSGSFDVVVDDSETKQTFSLNRSYYGLYLPAGLWRQMQNFSTNSLALVLSSTHYDEKDYIYDYCEYLNFRRDNEKKSVYDCVILPLNKIHNRAGKCQIIEGKKNIPFDIKRVYYLYDIPGGEDRGGHAHKELRQLIVAASGSFNVLLDDGINKKVVTLNRPDYGLLVVPGRWRLYP